MVVVLVVEGLWWLLDEVELMVGLVYLVVALVQINRCGCRVVVVIIMRKIVSQAGLHLSG